MYKEFFQIQICFYLKCYQANDSTENATETVESNINTEVENKVGKDSNESKLGKDNNVRKKKRSSEWAVLIRSCFKGFFKTCS